jgi:hypothetical protein
LSNHSFDYIVYHYAEYLTKDRLFWGQLNIYVTPEGAAYFEKLEAKAHAGRFFARVSETETHRIPRVGFRDGGFVDSAKRPFLVWSRRRVVCGVEDSWPFQARGT